MDQIQSVAPEINNKRTKPQNGLAVELGMFGASLYVRFE